VGLIGIKGSKVFFYFHGMQRDFKPQVSKNEQNTNTVQCTPFLVCKKYFEQNVKKRRYLNSPSGSVLAASFSANSAGSSSTEKKDGGKKPMH
jgi:hypothetical protein